MYDFLIFKFSCGRVFTRENLDNKKREETMDTKPSIRFYGKPSKIPKLPDISKTDQVQMFKLLAASRMFQVELARHRSDVPTPMLIGLRQENAPLAFTFGLWELGGEALLLDSIKSGDHRSQYTVATSVD